jgi:5-formyltetrahydrofolate cyclo-ligase
MVSKQTLREVYLSKRLTLSQQEYELRNALIRKQLLSYISLNDVKCIHIFLSITDKKEVDTQSIIDEILRLKPLMKFVVPKTLLKGHLDHYYLNEHCEIAVNKWGIPEPIKGERANLSIIDLILVPLIIFDKEGNRVGYGKGFYDRFLSQMEHVEKVGLSLLPSLDKIDSIEKTDVKLDKCVTPFELHQFV